MGLQSSPESVEGLIGYTRPMLYPVGVAAGQVGSWTQKPEQPLMSTVAGPFPSLYFHQQALSRGVSTAWVGSSSCCAEWEGEGCGFAGLCLAVPNRHNTLSGMQMKRNVHEACREVAKLVTGLFCLLVIGQWFQLLFSFPFSFVYI